MSAEALQRMLAAGERTDWAGHCKLCGERVQTLGAHVMRDPDGVDPTTIDFCSAVCLESARTIFDHLDETQLAHVVTEIRARHGEH